MVKKLLVVLILTALFGLALSKAGTKYYWDISSNRLNTLSTTSQQLIDSLEAPILLEIYSPNMAMLNLCDEYLAQYARHSKLVRIELKQTLIDAKLSDKLKLRTDNNLVVTYKDHQIAIDIKPVDINEVTISNLILQASSPANQWIIFLEGHQESNPYDKSELGMSKFTELMQDRGLHVAQLNLAQQQQIPENTSTIVVANPQFELLALEQQLLQQFVNKGGNLIWFTEPDAQSNQFLREAFGIKLAAGVIIDPNSSKLGSPHPALKIISKYPAHNIDQNLNSATIMPWSAHLDLATLKADYTAAPFITTNDQTWTYTGAGSSDIKELAKDKGIDGPLNIGVTVALKNPESLNAQRIIIVADSSFILNKYYGLYGNAQLISNMLAWVQNSKPTLVFTAAAARDLSYNPNNFDRFLQRYGFTIILPLLMIGFGFMISRRNDKLA